MTVAEVRLWGRAVGAVAVDGPGQVASFEYTQAFRRGGVEIAPLMMPLASTVYRFPALPSESFRGLPGLLADSLPDRFGNAVLDAWLASQGRLPDEIDAVERLCYTGSRGMGALEFRPALGPRGDRSTPLRVDALVELASEVLQGRAALRTSFDDDEREHALREILRVGASAGGARAKAVIAWNPETNEVRSGQVAAPPGFEHWILKFDGVENIAFLMEPGGAWSLSPAFDMNYAFNPDGLWTAKHQMTLNAKRDAFTIDDFRAFGETASMRRGRAEEILSEVVAAARR